MHTCIHTHTCRYVYKHVIHICMHKHPIPYSCFHVLNGWNFKGKNKIVPSLFIYFMTLPNTDVLFKGTCFHSFSVGLKNKKRGEEKDGTNNKMHVSVSTSSLTCLTLLTCKWGKEGFGFNLNSKLCCWK